ncbi:efflux RND transporter periplasmic adaptor subunit [Methyloceanibacter sp.]|uniref:efflux RND transporter periplasmic adaptor subunit n=1 Tax=Methyloceanibacter sp. TaxID=1965321 RepID=UPI002BF20DCD|nr:efflux RND transporter periplasmic adaptor subunit [Methyloceanibacter sp.]HML92994.1 efflux RND transporter periplasmic adaptor subunit [Methyloceanibacter sp.]
MGATIFVALIAVVALAVWLPSTRDEGPPAGAHGVGVAGSVIAGAEAHSGEGPTSERGHNHDDEDAGAPTSGDRVAVVKEDSASSSEDEHEHGGPEKADEHAGEETPHTDEDSALSLEKLQRLGVEVAVADDGPIALEIERPAEVKFDSDLVVHIVPRVAGVVSKVATAEGQTVEKDQLLAVLQSRELAELKAAYLADLERLSLAGENFERERRLWEKKISSEKDYLAEKSAFAEAKIALTASEQKLRALGLSQQYVDTLKESPTDLTNYEIRAPIGGTVIERHLSLGEAVSTDAAVFMIAETSSVWVDITVHPEDLPNVGPGQTVQIELGNGSNLKGSISFVTANVHEETRTAVARVIIDSADGRLKPGMFVKALIEVGKETGEVRIPKSAVQNFNNSPVVFVQEGDSFEPRPVRLGRENSKYVQILAGVEEGESYAAEGAFTLKALIQKSQIGEGHAH